MCAGGRCESRWRCSSRTCLPAWFCHQTALALAPRTARMTCGCGCDGMTSSIMKAGADETVSVSSRTSCRDSFVNHCMSARSSACYNSVPLSCSCMVTDGSSLGVCVAEHGLEIYGCTIGVRNMGHYADQRHDIATHQVKHHGSSDVCTLPLRVLPL